MFGDALLECLYNTDAHILDKALPDSYQLFDAGTTFSILLIWESKVVTFMGLYRLICQ